MSLKKSLKFLSSIITSFITAFSMTAHGASLAASASAAAATEEASELVISIDSPDPDNFFMLQTAAKLYPGRNINVILSPRPVDLSIKMGEARDYFVDGKFNFPKTLSQGFADRAKDTKTVLYASDYGSAIANKTDTMNRVHSKIVHIVSATRLPSS